MTDDRGGSGHTVPLGETGWRLWRDVAVRSAGFPAARVLSLCDDRLARAADARPASPGAGSDDEYQAAYQAAGASLSQAVAAIAGDPSFREAVTWQNPALLETCLDRVVPSAPRNRKSRTQELAIASYLQRYCLKNDTIGFFGPVAWATLAEGDEGMTVTSGERLLARRTTYFESWAIRELGRAIASRDDVFSWLCPRPDPAVFLSGNRLHRPRRGPVVLSPAQKRLFLRCDGRRTVAELFAAASDAHATLAELEDLGAVRVGFPVPFDTNPEHVLRDHIDRIEDAGVRAAARRPLDELERARDEVASAAGDPRLLREAMAGLTRCFQHATGVPGTRRHGEAYAGRTLVYEDTVRDVEVRLGSRIVDMLAVPLGLVLDSARWLVAEIADRYRTLFEELFEAECRRTGATRVPLTRLVLLATPDISTAANPVPERALPAIDEFQARWQDVLGTPAAPVRRHAVDSSRLAGKVASGFPRRPVPWSTGTHYSPDLMIAAASPAAVDRGDFLAVLGELHMTANTLESGCLVAQHPEPARLLDAATAEHGARRVVTLPPDDNTAVTPRVGPPTPLLSPEFSYWAAGEVAVPPARARVLPAAASFVTRDGPGLLVTCASTGATFPLLEMVADLMTGVVVNAFQPVAVRTHRPRVTVDRLVLAREAWRFSLDEAEWVTVPDEATRYRLARHWRCRHGLPERVFYRVHVEAKPVALDFRSLALVNLLAKNVRRNAEAGHPTFTVTEMLPDVDQLWLADAAGARYTSELRLVASCAATENRGA